MGLTIKRKKDSRVVKCLLHRIADIPGGVSVSVANLGGHALYEGTPIGKSDNGLFVVCKTAKILTQANESATSYEVAKGHHFKSGDRFAVNDSNGQLITTIDTSNESKDIITLQATLGKAVNAGDCAFESASEGNNLKVTPIAVTGQSEDVTTGDNLFVSAWVIGVVRGDNAPIVNDKIKTALKGVVYV